MAGLCPSGCGDTTLLANPQSNCKTDVRSTTPSRIFFYLCDTDLPDPITNNNIATFFNQGLIVATSPLANIVWADPTFEDVVVDDCSPANRILNTREMTFEDRVRVQITNGSPASVTDDSADYDFWLDKLDNQGRLRYAIGYCNGDVKLARDRDGNPLTASLQTYLTYQKASTQGGSAIEFKKGSIIFQGDPLALYNKVAFNWIEAGIAL